MQEILNQFGVEPLLLLAQIVNFLLVLFLLKKFALRPILSVLKERQKTIAESIKNAEDAQKALESATEKEKQILQKAQTEAKEVLSDARMQATDIVKTAEENTKEQVDRMLEDAQKKITKQTDDAEKELASKVTTLATVMLKSSLKGLLSEKEQGEVVEKATNKLKRN